MITVQITGVQDPSGRAPSDVVQAFGYRVLDPQQMVGQVLISVRDAVELITEGVRVHEFPEVEVEDEAWIRVVATGKLRIVHFQRKDG